MTEQQIPLPFRKPARLSAAQRKAMIQIKLQDYPVYQAARMDPVTRTFITLAGIADGFLALLAVRLASGAD